MSVYSRLFDYNTVEHTACYLCIYPVKAQYVSLAFRGILGLKEWIL